MTSLPICRICSEDTLTEIAGFGNLARVTSDCKTFSSGGRLAVCIACGAVQKPTDAKWQAEADEIYGQYTPYHSSDGAEQAVFDAKSGSPRPRSSVILEHLESLTGISDAGSILDVGCGNGALLSAFSKFRANWSLDGQDISDINLPSLKAVPGFRKLHAVPLPEVGERYDIVTLMHSLEHFPDPLQGLNELKQVLAEDSVLLVQVPNIEATPFDLLIADHVSHFTAHDLETLCFKAGYQVLTIADDWIAKELSVVARPRGENGGSLTVKTPPAQVLARVSAQINWLNAVVKQAKMASETSQSFGIFGTSIAATWLFGQLSDAVDFFVDEDPSCQGRELFGRPILPPSEVPTHAIVHITLIPEIAKLVSNRLEQNEFRLCVPPNIEI